MEEDELKRDQVQTLTLALFDLYWFHRLILFHLPPPPPPPPPLLPPPLPPPPPPETDVEDAATPESLLLRRRLSHRRSLSDDLSPPTLHPCRPKLQTILSGKEAVDGHEIRGSVASGDDGERRRRRRRDRRRRQRSRTSKSLSELEFEEVKGFMDLGFTFSDVDADPRLMEIVPGLQRLKASPAAEEEEAADDEVARPYLSEAWDDDEEEEEIEEGKMGNFEIPIVGGDGVDLKDQLRFWAHAVASTVR